MLIAKVQLHTLALLPSQKRVKGHPCDLAHQVVQGDVDGGAGKRLAVAHRRGDRLVHAPVSRQELERVEADEPRAEVTPHRGDDRLHGLVAPGGERARLAPTDAAGIRLDSHEDVLAAASRGPHRAPSDAKLAAKADTGRNRFHAENAFGHVCRSPSSTDNHEEGRGSALAIIYHQTAVRMRPDLQPTLASRELPGPAP